MADVADIAVGPLSTAANYYLQRDAAARNQQYYRENIAENFKYSQQAQRNAAANEVIGLRNAGLSPVLANGAAGASQVSAQGGTMQAPTFDPSNMLLMAQLDNLKAQKEKTEADAEATELQNDQTKAKNEFTGESMRLMAKQMMDKPYVSRFPAVVSFLNALAENKNLNAGTMDAWSQLVNQMAVNPEAVNRKLKAEFESANDGFKQEYRLNEQQISKLTEEATNLTQQFFVLKQQELALQAGQNLTEEQKKQAEAAVKQIDASIEQMKAQAKRLESYNLPELMKKGDVKGTAAAILALLVEGILHRGNVVSN